MQWEKNFAMANKTSKIIIIIKKSKLKIILCAKRLS